METTFCTLKHCMFSTAFGSRRANATFIEKKEGFLEDCVSGMFLT